MPDSKFMSMPSKSNVGATSNISTTPSPLTDSKELPKSKTLSQEKELLKIKGENNEKLPSPSTSNQTSPLLKITPLIISEEKEIKLGLTKANSSKESPMKESIQIKTGIKNDYDFLKLIERNLYGDLFSGIRKSDKICVNIQTIDKTSKIDLKNTRRIISERFTPYLVNEYPLVQKLYDIYEDSNMFYVCSEALDYSSLLDNLIDDSFKEIIQ